MAKYLHKTPILSKIHTFYAHQKDLQIAEPVVTSLSFFPIEQGCCVKSETYHHNPVLLETEEYFLFGIAGNSPCASTQKQYI